MPREVFYDQRQPNRGLPLVYPASDRRIQDDWTVWAFTDTHGVLAGLITALFEAGLVDDAGRWTAKPKTALVGVGDYIDRGPDSAGVVALLSRLRVEASEGGGRVVLVRGNHEHMLSDILRGDREWEASWLSNGGPALLASYGLRELPSGRSWDAVLADEAPGLLRWLLATWPFAVWRDVLFVHAAPIAGGSLQDLEDGDLQLWDPTAFLRGGGIVASAYEAYRSEGVQRVVVGHVPQDDGPTVLHEGTTLLLDANACALPHFDGTPRSAYTCLAQISPDGPIDLSRFILVDSS